jgi:hypothetical protein
MRITELSVFIEFLVTYEFKATILKNKIYSTNCMWACSPLTPSLSIICSDLLLFCRNLPYSVRRYCQHS